MDLAERNRLVAATEGFQQLRGLIYAPAGLANVGVLLINRAWPFEARTTGASAWPAIVFFLAIVLSAFGATVAAFSYYRRRFGVVRPKCGGGQNALRLTLVTIVAVGTLIGAMYVDSSFWIHPAASYPVSFTCLWWALFYLACYLCPYRVRPHSLWFAALFLGFCFLTLTGVVPKSQFFLSGSGSAGEIFIWLAFSIHGLLDHLLLLRLLPKASPEQATEQHV
jgi:hypothetical protein